MLNQRIEIRRSGSLVSKLGFVISGLLLIAAAVFRNFHLMLGAILPIALGITCRRKAHHEDLVLDDDGIDFQTFNFRLAYRDITWLSLGNRFVTNSTSDLNPGPIGIGYHGGHVQLPEQLSVPPQEFVQFLFERIPPRQAEQPPSLLTEHWTKECGRFGNDKITVIHSRKVVPSKQGCNKYMSVGLGCLAAGFICMVLSVATLDPKNDISGAWIGISLITIIVGIILCFIGHSQNRQLKQEVSTSRGACMIISPSGLAMIQGPLKGILRWDEILKVESGPAGSFSDRDSALNLIISGGKITVLDVYETPLVSIASLIRKNLGLKT